MRIDLPDPSLVVLIGPSGSGKSSFARRHFAPTEVISSDFCRGLVADDENDQSATVDAFAVLNFIADRRLAQPRFTVVDATNVQREARRPLVQLAKQHDLFGVAIVLDIPEGICQERNRLRPDRSFGPHVVRQQRAQLHKSLKGLQREGFRRVHVLHSVEEIDAAEVQRTPLWTDRRADHGPFDVIGDIHGCYSELIELLRRLGYDVASDGVTVTAPAGRRAVFLGDYGDRGPDTPGVLKLVMAMANAGTAICLPGNHDVKLVRKLKGRDVQITHGLIETLEQLERETDEFRDQSRDFLDRLVSHVVLDDGKLVVAHAGMKQAYQDGLPDACATSRCSARRPEKPTNSVCPSGCSGHATTGATRTSSTATPRLPSLNGSTTRSTSTPDACSAGVSRRCAGLNESSCRSRRTGPTTSLQSRSYRPTASTRPPPRTDQPSCSTSRTWLASASSRRGWRAPSLCARRTPPRRWR